jgi:hypothetical protein
MVRSALGVIGGGVAWMVGFFVLARLLYMAWPAYALRAQTYMSGGAYDFTPAMSGFHASFWFLAEVGAGWLTVTIAKRREAAWILAGLLMAYMSAMHLYLYWDRFPWWYNLVVALPVVPAVWVGGALASRAVLPSRLNEAG